MVKKRVYIVYVDGVLHNVWGSARAAVTACTVDRYSSKTERMLYREGMAVVDYRTYIQRYEVRH